MIDCDMHVSIQFTLLPGKYDDRLEWPFNAGLSTEILNSMTTITARQLFTLSTSQKSL